MKAFQSKSTAAPSRSSAAWGYAADHPLTTVFSFALFVRLINLSLLTGRDAFFAEQDTFAYWTLGAALAKPDGFWPTLLSMTDRMPLYPLLLRASSIPSATLPERSRSFRPRSMLGPACSSPPSAP
jgi:hypothetical protein